ncbi:GNAT family N-acetyltransferase [Ornithinibacillus contaminans]|uniref:GNAT family N-acetyltransferase n=1 Tax=Ornithinibacillus contaminans TaxID=694055 RepID=UPI00064D996F|nr:GNAT family N-acetyltransferase [Ornithinibacillus contaminans]
MIRLLEPKDAIQYFLLRKEALTENPEAFATTYEELMTGANPEEAYKKSIESGESYTFGAFEEEKLVGVVTMVPENKEKLKHKATIVGMYVTPTKRGNGIGKALMEAAISKAKELGDVVKLNLTVVSINDEAKALYTKIGFETYGLEEKALKMKNVYFDEEYMTLFL